VNQDDIYRLYALCCAAIGRSWAETDLVAGRELYDEQKVTFSAMGAPALTDAGKNELRDAIAGMRGVL
jgi:hypothetical protein